MVLFVLRPNQKSAHNEEEYRLTCSFIHSLVFLSLREQVSLHIVVGFDKQTTNSKLKSGFVFTRKTGGNNRVSYPRAHSGIVWEMTYTSTDENKAMCQGSEHTTPLITPGCAGKDTSQ